MLAPARVRVLVQGRAVKPRQRVGIPGKVGRHPVQDDADAALVQVIDKVAEVVGAAKTLGRGEIPGGLVTPGIVQGMLGDRQQFHMGEAQLRHIVRQLVRHIPEVQKLPVLVSPPGAG